jgi:nicotinamidase-related amidase
MMSAEAAAKGDEDFFRERGFGQRIGFGQRPALIVIDFIKAFTDPDMMLGADVDAEIAATRPLVDVAHERGIPVIYTGVAYEDPQFRDAGIWRLKQKGTETLRAGTDAITLDPRLEFRPGDAMIYKKYASSFFGTDLAARLVSAGVDTLVITGCTTSGCVRATAVDAVQTGLRPMVVREAVGDRSAAAHAQSLFDLDAKYADVVSLDETLGYLRGIGHNAAEGR